jgi:hypothetical protein
MRHVQKALNRYHLENYLEQTSPYIQIDNADENEEKFPPVVKFTLQADAIQEVGENGLQPIEFLKYVKCYFESLDNEFPSKEGAFTILKIEEGINWQLARQVNWEKQNSIKK